MWNIILIGLVVALITTIGVTLLLLIVSSKEEDKNKYWTYKIKK